MSDLPVSDLPMTSFERRLEARVLAYAATHEPIVDAERIAYVAEDAAIATTRRWFGGGAGVWVPALLGLLLLIGAAVFAAGVLLTLIDKKPLATNGLIAYDVGDVRMLSVLGRIHIMDADGTNDRDAGPGSCPRYLADGSALTYVSSSDEFGLRAIVFAEPDLSSVRDVGPFTGAGMAISPDGQHLASLESATPTSFVEDQIWLTDVSNGTRRLLVPAAQAGEPAQVADVDYTSLTWSPDGSSIAYAVMQLVQTGDNSGKYRKEIDVVDVESGVVRVVSSRPGTDFVDISWSPDSRSLAYLGLPDDSPLPVLPAAGSPLDQWDLPEDVFVVRLDGSGDRNITTTAGGEIFVQWAPSGSAIAYQDRDAPSLAVAEVDAAEGNINHYSGPGARSYAWSPDGTALLYSQRQRDPDSGELIGSTLSRVDPRFQNPPQTIVETGETIGCVSWQSVWP
jgi:WD40 repeat protein